MNERTSAQPILPRVSMRWYFVAVLAVACLMALLVTSTQSKTPSVILLVMSLFLGSFLLLSALLFLLAFAIGSVEKIIFRVEEQPQSPFAHETLPPQILPPISE